MKHIMIDLETLGKRSNAAIIAIGAVKFDEEGNVDSDNVFYRNIYWDDAIKVGTIDVSTIKWWIEQGAQARKEAIKMGFPLAESLIRFNEWSQDQYYIWGNGATFDISILKNAYQKIGAPIPWSFRNERDMRTIMHPLSQYMKLSDFDQVGTSHKAIDDAMFQAKVVSTGLKTINGALKKCLTK